MRWLALLLLFASAACNSDHVAPAPAPPTSTPLTQKLLTPDSFRPGILGLDDMPVGWIIRGRPDPQGDVLTCGKAQSPFANDGTNIGEVFLPGLSAGKYDHRCEPIDPGLAIAPRCCNKLQFGDGHALGLLSLQRRRHY